MHFGEPRKKYSNTLRHILTVLVAIFGIVLLVQSYGQSGRALDWRISAGISAMAFTFISIVSQLPEHPEILVFTPLQVVSLVVFYLSIFVIQRSGTVKSEWGQSILLEAGIAGIFSSAVDVLLESIVHDFRKREREEREFWDEAALHSGWAFELSLYEYWAMREMLDVVPPAETPTDAGRFRKLLEFAQKAKAMPARLRIFEQEPFKSQIAHDLRVLELVSEKAQSMNLTDDEFHYLRLIAGMRLDPDWQQAVPITETTMVMWVDNATEQIIRRRPRWIRKILPSLEPYDPLLALEEFERYKQDRFGGTLPPPNLDRTRAGDEDS